MCRLIRSQLFVSGKFFFFIVPATAEIYTLSLHDALPICADGSRRDGERIRAALRPRPAAVEAVRHHSGRSRPKRDRKSTRLNSSHQIISYAVFCLKKKKK